MNSKKLAWKSLKFIDNKMKSSYGDITWKIGEWKEESQIKLCNYGFHASKMLIDAYQYVTPDLFAQVEYEGEILEDTDKFVAKRMRVIKAYKWTKTDSMNFSIFCVQQSMKYFDRKKYPEVWTVCLNSIRAIKDVLNNDNDDTRSAAESAAESAAWSAESAARKVQNKWLIKYVKTNCEEIKCN